MASGSDKRQRGETVTVRLTKDERDTLDALASRSGMAVGAFMRAAAFGDAGPRAQRRPPIDLKDLRHLLGECGRIGNNLNQIAHHLNAGRSVDNPELQAALAAYNGEIRPAILRALAMDTTGEEPPRGGADFPRGVGSPMIIKGDSRGGPVQLARHLLRTDTNETVNIVQLNSPTGSLREALRDWQLISAGTRGSKGLYHANISPDARYAMTPEQWQRAVDVLEKELGFDGQPRVVVVHEKHDRQHIHVVWQRTDIDTMTLVSDSFNYVAHERASMALELEFGHQPVPGKHAKRNREKQPEFPQAEINHAEWQQAERAGADPHAFKDAITAVYAHSDNGQAFQTALEQHGFLLAKGDRRDYVIVNGDGQIYSLARQIKGVAAKDLRAFMADVDRDAIPSVEQAKALQEQRAHALEIASAENPDPPQPPTPQPEKSSIEKTAALERALRERHEEEAGQMRLRQQAEYEQTARVLAEEAREKLGHFDALQQAAKERFFRETYRAKTGIAGFIDEIKGVLNPRQLAEDARQRKEAADTFLRRQEQEREERLASLKVGQTADLADLTECHQQQQREHNAGYDQARARYRREIDAAAKLLAEIEERRRQEELRAERERTRDGPPPPERAR